MAQRVDEGHERTDKTIEEIEKRLEKEYQQASKEVTAKWEDYWHRHAAKDSIKQQQVASGKITLEEYTEWKHGQLCVGQRWKDLKDQLAQDLVNVDEKARSITQGYMSEVYALNHNYATFQVEHDSMIDTSYTLYNRRAVENMIRDDRSLLPYPKKDSKTDKMLRANKDLVWNRQHIHSAITQGILQGESNPQIAMRLRNVVGMDKKAAIRNARTMMTGVENKARKDAYDDLRDKGIDVREKWIATLDARTRSSHRWLHGTYKDEKGVYENGLEYPGDPKGDPAEVYNCRCCEIAEVMGHSIETPKYSPKIKGMTFDEWQAGKVKSKGLGAIPTGVQHIKTFSQLQKEYPNEAEKFLQIIKTGDYDKSDAEWAWKSYQNGNLSRIGENEIIRRTDKLFNAMDGANNVANKVKTQTVREVTAKKTEKVISKELKELQKSKIKVVKVNELNEKLTTKQIVSKISGGDKTGGSCVSLSLSYFGNEAGYDVRDFKGGESRDWFSKPNNLIGILESNGVPVMKETGTSFESAKKILENVQEGKEYLFFSGTHATAVTRKSGRLYYLEMQSPRERENGYHEMYDFTLTRRFKSRSVSDDLMSGTSCLVDGDALKKMDNFGDILGYINTAEGKEMKGVGGKKR